MSNPIDDLFNSKLALHTLAPSADAWAKVEASLAKKNKGLIWFRMAAALLLMGALTATIVWLSSRDHETGSKQLSQDKKIPMTAPVDSMKKSDGIKHDNVASSKVLTPRKQPKTNPAVNTVSEAPVSNQQASVPDIEKSEKVNNEITPAIDSTPVNAIEKVAVANKTEKPIVLEYTLESVEAVVPEEKVITLTIELKEKKGIQKVLDFARDAVNSDGPLATIRQAKEEFFAFNFKKDKTQKLK